MEDVLIIDDDDGEQTVLPCVLEADTAVQGAWGDTDVQGDTDKPTRKLTDALMAPGAKRKRGPPVESTPIKRQRPLPAAGGDATDAPSPDTTPDNSQYPAYAKVKEAEAALAELETEYLGLLRMATTSESKEYRERWAENERKKKNAKQRLKRWQKKLEYQIAGVEPPKKKKGKKIGDKTLTQHQRHYGDLCQMQCMFEKWTASARTRVDTTMPIEVLRQLVVPHATTVVPSEFDASTPVVVLTLDGRGAGEAFGKTKLKCGSRYATFRADCMDVVYFPPTKQVKIWWTMSRGFF